MRLDTSKLKRLRFASGETQEQVAARVGITERTYQSIESGVTGMPWPKTVRALADGFGVTVDDLIVEDEPAAAAQ